MWCKKQSIGIIGLLFFTSMCSLYAQKEASQYFYWKDSGIKFNPQGIEEYTTTNNISHIQPGKDFSPVLCDPAGNLLMYTNMENIFDRSGNVMENGAGLLANRNAEQGAVWVDLPASRGRYYYLFYSDAKGTAFGNFPHDSIVWYALIDMQGNGGLGKVLQKNIALHGGSSGFVAAVRHKNDVDTWVMTYHFHRKEFMAYLVSSCGIIGPVISKDNYEKALDNLIDPPSLFRFSPQGNMLACLHATISNGGAGVVGLWDFDNEQGTLSYKYGIEGAPINYFFSPSGQYIYLCQQWLQGLVQYDVTEPDSVSCYANRYELSPTTLSTHPGPFSLYSAHLYGQDGSVYLPIIPGKPEVWLTRLTYPDRKGAAAQLDTIDKNSKIAYSLFIHDHMYSYYRPGYRTPVYDIGEPKIAQLTICAGVEGKFQQEGALAGDSCVWKFGDGSQTSLVGDLNQAVHHRYAQAGKYQVELIRYFKCATDTARQEVTVMPKPYMSSLPDTVYYCGELFDLEVTSPTAIGFLWNTGSTSNGIQVSSGGQYKVKTIHACGVIDDSTYVQDMGLQVPNLVTPNGDQKNDYFEIVKKGKDVVSLKIYDSWGSQIYSSEDYRKDWPPSEVLAGIYFYHYSIFNCMGKGWIQVVR